MKRYRDGYHTLSMYFQIRRCGSPCCGGTIRYTAGSSRSLEETYRPS